MENESKSNQTEPVAVKAAITTLTATSTTTATPTPAATLERDPAASSPDDKGVRALKETREIEAKKNKKKEKNKIHVSNTKKPFTFYLNLATKYIKLHDGVELSALGMAIPTVVTISEILKRNGLAVPKNIKITTVNSKLSDNGLIYEKAKIEILLVKTEKLDKVTATASTEAADSKA